MVNIIYVVYNIRTMANLITNWGINPGTITTTRFVKGLRKSQMTGRRMQLVNETNKYQHLSVKLEGERIEHQNKKREYEEFVQSHPEIRFEDERTMKRLETTHAKNVYNQTEREANRVKTGIESRAHKIEDSNFDQRYRLEKGVGINYPIWDDDDYWDARQDHEEQFLFDAFMIDAEYAGFE